MRGRLTMTSLFGVRGLVPGLNRPVAVPTPVQFRPSFVKGVEGRVPRPSPMNPAIPAEGRELFLRRWGIRHLADDLEPIVPRDTSGIPSLVPAVAPSYTPPSSGGGFWNTIASGITGVLSSVVPAVAQIKTQQIVNKQGAQLYTPMNIQTLQNQAQYEAAQRQIEQGRQLNTTSVPLSATTLAVVGGAGLLLYLVMKRK